MSCVIGIGGGTGAGKTTVVRHLAERFEASVLDLDSYYRDRRGIDVTARALLNYDEPAAIDAGLLMRHVVDLAAGRSIAKPMYSFESHTRVGEQHVDPAPLIIVEGLFTLWWHELRYHFDVRVYVDAAPDIRLARRLSRDVTERGRTVAQVLRQYFDTVRPMHERYVEPCRAFADVVVSNEARVEETLDLVTGVVRRVIAPASAAQR